MKQIDLDNLIEWLGPDGAIAGLENSDLTVDDLFELGSHRGFSVEKKMRRTDLINELVNSRYTRINKTVDELMEMDYETLRALLEERRVSRTELLNLLGQLSITPGRGSRKSLLDFVAREISDLGMYRRVAKGRQGS